MGRKEIFRSTLHKTGDVSIDDSTSIIVLVKNCEKTITKTYEQLKHLSRQYHNITKICYTDLNSSDLSITLLALLIDRERDLSSFIIKHKKKVSLGKAISNSTKTLASNNIIIIDGKNKINIRNINRQIKLLHKAHIIIPQANSMNMAYRKEFVKFKPDNNLRKQLLKIAQSKHLRISKIE